MRIVTLDAAAFTALATGDAEAAGRLSPVPVSDHVLGPDVRRVWEIRRDQVGADPAQAAWVTGLVHHEELGTVGHAGFHGPPDERGMVEVGYGIDPRFRRRGLARATLELLLARAAVEPSVRVVRATVSPDNAASLRIVGDRGFRHVGEQIDEEDGLELVFELDVVHVDVHRVFDAHLHVVDPRFPLLDNDGFRPEEFRVADYRRATGELAAQGFVVTGGAVVSGSFQGFDQTYLRDALDRFGPGFVGVTQVPATVTDDDLRDLAATGTRGIRFNLRRGGSAGRDDLETLARRAFDVAGLHAELYVDARELPDLMPTLRRLPAVGVDHLGLHADGLPDLLRLVESGARVKATGFGRVELDVAEVVRAVLAVDPTALLAGTDLPSTRARRPFRPADLQLLADVADEHRAAVLHDNAAAFYRVG